MSVSSQLGDKEGILGSRPRHGYLSPAVNWRKGLRLFTVLSFKCVCSGGHAETVLPVAWLSDHCDLGVRILQPVLKHIGTGRRAWLQGAARKGHPGELGAFSNGLTSFNSSQLINRAISIRQVQ